MAGLSKLFHRSHTRVDILPAETGAAASQVTVTRQDDVVGFASVADPAVGEADGPEQWAPECGTPAFSKAHSPRA
jgi:hypothetical protein